MIKLLKYKNTNIEFCAQITRPPGLRMFCYAYHIVWISLCLRSVAGVRVLASVVDDWLLCRVGEFASCLPVHRGGWCRLSVVPLSGCCFGGIFGNTNPLYALANTKKILPRDRRTSHPQH